MLQSTPAAVGAGTPAAVEAGETCYQPTPEGGLIDGTPAVPSERLARPSPVPTPQPFEPLPFVPDAALESRIREVLGEQLDSYAVVVKDLTDGTGAAVNGDKTFYAASLFKVPVMFEAFQQRSLGLLALDDELLVTPYYAGFDLGTLPVEVCQTLNVGEALAYMMSISDNTSANLLQDRVGAANVNRSMEALGLTTTRLLEDDLPVTADDMALLLEAIARGAAIGESAGREMVYLLATEETDNGLKAGLPEEMLVAHKTGNWTNATHDAGIVYSAPAAEQGEPDALYVVVVLSDRGYESEEPLLIEDVSRAVWEYYSTSAE